MDRWNGPGDEASDEELVARAREGDRTAFAELWVRHARAGITVARGFTSSLDADDLVAEAFARIYQRVLDGGGPDGAFRPYLYTTIRNLASRWGSGRNDIQIEDIEDLHDDSIPADPSTVALDARLTAQAFQSLPERWQSVLWYTEVEGMAPQEVAPILGLTANGVAALAYRAREGLRTAWLQAHVSFAGTGTDCQWAISRLGENSRHALTKREQARLNSHLHECESCESVAMEVDEIGSSLAGVLIPLLLGVTVGGTLISTLGQSSSAAAAVLPAVPSAIMAASGSAPVGAAIAGSAGAVGAATGISLPIPVLAGALAAAIVLGGGAIATPTPAALPPAVESNSRAALVSSTPHSSTPAVGSADGVEGLAVPTWPNADGTGDSASAGPVGGLVTELTDPLRVVIPLLPVGPVPEHSAPSGLVGAVVDLDLMGKGMPGATVSAQVAGQVYTTVVASNGTWAIRLTALPDGVGPITLKQRLTVLGIVVPLDIPLSLLSDTLGITVDLLN